MAEEENSSIEEEDAQEQEEVEEGAPMWIVSYGDMMTLLLCFFILYFQMDTTNGMREVAEKNSVISDVEAKSISDRRIKEKDQELKIIQKLIQKHKQEPKDKQSAKTEQTQTQSISKQMVTILRKNLKDTTIKMVASTNKVELTLPAESYFARGKAKLFKKKRPVFHKIVDVLKDIKKNKKKDISFVEVEGHSDDIIIQGWLSRYFPSNWELSSARASAIVRIFRKAGLKTDYRVIGLAHTKPLVPNISERNRSLNRRVVVRIRFGGKETGKIIKQDLL